MKSSSSCQTKRLTKDVESKNPKIFADVPRNRWKNFNASLFFYTNCMIRRFNIENVRRSFIKKDKKQNSDSVEVRKRIHFLEKTDKINTSKSKTNIKISFTKSYRDSLHSASILSCSKSDQTTPVNNFFKFPDFTSQSKKNESILTTKNLEKLQEKETLQRKLPTSKTTSQRSRKSSKGKKPWCWRWW